jgi:hypothetical protein
MGEDVGALNSLVHSCRSGALAQCWHVHQSILFTCLTQSNVNYADSIVQVLELPTAHHSIVVAVNQNRTSTSTHRGTAR